MGVLIQIRDVPEDVHRALKARAALEGTSLTEYLRAECRRLVATPTPEELQAKLLSLGDVPGERRSAADLVRQGREERERELADRVRR